MRKIKIKKKLKSLENVTKRNYKKNFIREKSGQNTFHQNMKQKTKCKDSNFLFYKDSEIFASGQTPMMGPSLDTFNEPREVYHMGAQDLLSHYHMTEKSTHATC